MRQVCVELRLHPLPDKNWKTLTRNAAVALDVTMRDRATFLELEPSPPRRDWERDAAANNHLTSLVQKINEV